ncbi:MAG: hypothetical protein GW779_05760 [Candidatus Altiarchaeum hamiconexum]|uniref:Uncharacterized protein n=1 Tax=Candidatus Altarchaeum hamiconexum TaxID=1803513 RepID=A0A8J7Z2P6_9ARCH|nr:hypothetical protein [Candidatus Altarchaeum hamiconexum]NCN68334.1 hypothetical protein [Candidatus Altarchaeum hamiconexum]NCS91888.1 hypothetical protein [Candidatus Altarchaeum hamiconexum]NCT01128.1 hypothetical protein [Candidatus Altarchaeum hamiconexum]
MFVSLHTEQFRAREVAINIESFIQKGKENRSTLHFIGRMNLPACLKQEPAGPVQSCQTVGSLRGCYQSVIYRTH